MNMSGYGREFRERLLGRWGIVDVNDCCSCATFLVITFFFPSVLVMFLPYRLPGTVQFMLICIFSSRLAVERQMKSDYVLPVALLVATQP